MVPCTLAPAITTDMISDEEAVGFNDFNLHTPTVHFRLLNPNHLFIYCQVHHPIHVFCVNVAGQPQIFPQLEAAAQTKVRVSIFLYVNVPNCS